MRAWIGLGGNLGEDPAKTLRRAREALARLPRTQVKRVSSLYRTRPVGYADQPWFVNQVVELDTGLSPHALLGACLGIEAAFGRVRRFPNGPRVLDLDVLLIDGVRLNESELTLPHPRMGERGFVLVPLAELYPAGVVCGYDFRDALAQCDTTGVERLSDPPAAPSSPAGAAVPPVSPPD